MLTYTTPPPGSQWRLGVRHLPHVPGSRHIASLPWLPGQSCTWVMYFLGFT